MAGFYLVKHWMAGYNLMLWDVKNIDVAERESFTSLVFAVLY